MPRSFKEMTNHRNLQYGGGKLLVDVGTSFILGGRCVSAIATLKSDIAELVDQFEHYPRVPFFKGEKRKKAIVVKEVDLTHALLVKARLEKLRASSHYRNEHRGDKYKSLRKGEHLRSRTGVIQVIY